MKPEDTIWAGGGAVTATGLPTGMAATEGMAAKTFGGPPWPQLFLPLWFLPSSVLVFFLLVPELCMARASVQ